MRRKLIPLALFTMLIALAPLDARAQGLEVGASLASMTTGLGDNDFSVFGVPSSALVMLNPGVYAAFSVTDRIAVGPQAALLLVTEHGHSDHLANVGGQIDVFLQNARRSAPYAFIAGGFLHESGGSRTPKYVSGGAGYRIRTGEQLAFRLDGRFNHYTDNGGNTLTFTVSLGGVFRR